MATKFKNLLVFVTLVFMLSCQKNDTTPADTSKVKVTFNTPEDGQVFHKGDTVNINTNVAYVSELKGITLQIIDTLAGDVLYEDSYDLHTDHFSIGGYWVDTASDSAMLQVKVTVFITANTSLPAVRTAYIKSLP